MKRFLPLTVIESAQRAILFVVIRLLNRFRQLSSEFFERFELFPGIEHAQSAIDSVVCR